MPTKKRPAGARKSTAARTPRLRVKSTPPPAAVVAAATGSTTPTVIYIHGIGNKPKPSTLKCQWDTALFGTEMGERTRLAYWVNRERYPKPVAADCATKDVVAEIEEGASAVTPTLGARALDRDAAVLDQEIAMIADNEEQRRILKRVVSRMEGSITSSAAGLGALAVSAKVLPLPSAALRRFFARQVSRVFARDFHDFFFDAKARAIMRNSLLERIKAGPGPFIVIAHSQGTMIAYDVLRELNKAQADVRLFITMGSPLGMQEVQDLFRKQLKIPKGKFPFPPCVSKWVNVAERLDVVSIDTDLSGEFAGPIQNHDGFFLNPDSPRHPHSATGYLSTKFVKDAVRGVAGNAFSQSVARFVIANDLVNDLENAADEERRDVLIQLADSSTGTAMAETAAAVKTRLEDIVADKSLARIDVLKRFISASLTRSETERIAAEFGRLRISTIWKNAEKRALIYQSTDTIQCRPGNTSYGATGKNIQWAVLDTGIRASHPHFNHEGARTVVAQWDCTGTGTVKPIGPDADRNGHGTHVAGIIAGKHTTKIDVDGETIEYAGMAPLAKLHDYKVLDDQGFGQDSYIIKALDHIADLNEAAGDLVIHGINVSLGGNFDPQVFGCGHTPLCQEIRRLWRQGVVVVLAAGNEGYAVLLGERGDVPANIDLSIGDPANLDEAIAVGSVHRTNPHTYGVSYFSSRGPTADGRRKPDVVAPGERIVSACHQYPEGATLGKDLYIEMSGTSMAAPHVSGLLAAFLSLRREFIGYPDRVKEILTSNCVDLKRDPYIQGYGLPNLILMLARN